MSTTMDSKLASLLIIFFDFTDFFLLEAKGGKIINPAPRITSLIIKFPTNHNIHGDKKILTFLECELSHN